MEPLRPRSCFISMIDRDAKEIAQLLPSPTSSDIAEKASFLISILHKHFPCFQKEKKPRKESISVILEESVEESPVFAYKDVPTCMDLSIQESQFFRQEEKKGQDQKSLLNLCKKMLKNITDLEQTARSQLSGLDSQNFNLALDSHQIKQIQDLLSEIPKELLELINMAQPPQEKTLECLSNHNSKEFCEYCNQKSSKRSLLTEQIRKRKAEEAHIDDIGQVEPQYLSKNSISSQKRKYSQGNFTEPPPLSFSQFSHLSLKEKPGDFDTATGGKRGRIRTRKILGEMNMEEMDQLEIKPGKNEKSCSKCLIY